jgi:hypothetical protein
VYSQFADSPERRAENPKISMPTNATYFFASIQTSQKGFRSKRPSFAYFTLALLQHNKFNESGSGTTVTRVLSPKTPKEVSKDS